MDDRELEARLRTRLHRRFDDATPSPEMVASVAQVISTQRHPAGALQLRVGAFSLGWPVVAAAALLAVVVAVAGPDLGGLIGPGSAKPTSVVPSAAPTERQFIVLPPAGHVPGKAEDGLAANILSARLRAFLSVDSGGFTSAVGNAITFMLPTTGPPDESIRTVLRSPGDVQFVPLPASYADGTHVAAVGQPLPTDEPALFGRDGIATAAMDTDQQGRPVLTIRFRPEAAEAFDDYTATHVGSTFAIVIDGDVALMPVVNEPIRGGEVQVSGGGLPGSRENRAFAEASAILVGGTLPDAWLEPTLPTVPEILPPQDIAAILDRELPGVTLEDATLDAITSGPPNRWIAVWRTQLGGLTEVCAALPARSASICAPTEASAPEGSMDYLFDAETGEYLTTEPI